MFTVQHEHEYEDEVSRTITSFIEMFYFSMIRFREYMSRNAEVLLGKVFEPYSLSDSAALNRKEQPGAIRMLLDLKSHLKM